MNDPGWLASVWLLRTLAAGSALLLLAWLALRVTKNAAQRQRLAAWTFRGAVLAAILGAFPAWLTIPVKLNDDPVPVSHRVPPSPEVPVESVAGEPLDFIVESDIAFEPEPMPIQTLSVAPPAPVPEVKSTEPQRAYYPWLLGAYGVLASMAALQLVLALIALVRLRRSSKPAPEEIVLLAKSLAAPAAPPRVMISARVATPVCFGWWHPVVLLPQSLADSAKDEELRWVLAHELDHLRRGDPFTGLWVGLARMLYFAVPWFWAVRRELRLAQEYLADAAAAADRPADYAAFLVSLSESPARRVPLGAMAVRAGSTDLYRRVSMLTQGKVRSGSSRVWSLLTAGGVLGTAVALSGLGFADDKKPTSEIELVIIADDAPKKDGDKKAERKDGEKKSTLTVVGGLIGPDELKALSKHVNEALEKGDVAAAKEAMAKLNKALAAQPKVWQVDNMRFTPTAPGVPATPATPFAPVAPGGAGMGTFRVKIVNDEDVKKLEEKIESLKKALEGVKDSPEAREALEKTIAEFKKKIAEARHSGEMRIAPLAGDVQKAHAKLNATLNKLDTELQEVSKKLSDGGLSDEAKAKLIEQKEVLIKSIGDVVRQLAELKAQGAVPFGNSGGGALFVPDEATRRRGQADMEAARAKLAEARAKLENEMQSLAAKMKAAGDDPEAQAKLKEHLAELRKVQDDLARKADVLQGDPASPLFGSFRGPVAGRGVSGSGRFGITIDTIPAALADQLNLAQGNGILITGTVPGSVAEKAGVKANDILVSLNGKAVPADAEGVVKIVGEIKAGEKFDVVVIRKGKKEVLKDITIPAPKPRRDESDSGKPRGEGLKFNQMNVNVNDGHFEIDAKNDEASYHIVGDFVDGEKKVSKVRIQHGKGEAQEYKDFDKIPKSDRAAIEQLVSHVSGSRK